MPPAMMLGQMIVELGVYGLCTGLLNQIITINNELLKYYLVLIISMVVGRITYGICNALLFKAGNYSLSIWLSAAFIKGLPGIIIQLVLIPTIVKTIKKLLN